MTTLQFAPLCSDVELPFYSALASRKIDHDKLDDSIKSVTGRYEIIPGDAPERSARMQVHGDALASEDIPFGYYGTIGNLRNVNTIEEYKEIDRAALLDHAGRDIWHAIQNGSIYSDPSLLASFYVIFFADLKKYKFHYHFAFPALQSQPPWKSVESGESPSRLNSSDTKSLIAALHDWKAKAGHRQHGFFLAKRSKKYSPISGVKSLELNEGEKGDGDSATDSSSAHHESKWEVESLSGYGKGFFDDVSPEDRFISFADPSTYPENPGWMLRNLLMLVFYRWRLNDVQILCYREAHNRHLNPSSVILHLHNDAPVPETSEVSSVPMPKVTGWERNEHNKLNSKIVDLSAYLSPHHLADQSVDLNLKLMKWRIAPELDLDAIKNTKCLLLGAGTLGSYVSRNLLGWGVRKVTFIDNGRVSFSNPVRQPLYDFEDCREGGKEKALRAAESLREIYPGAEAEGYVMSVPMAGHPVMELDEAKVKEEFETLRRLISEHDAIILLMDSRESRWLPSVIGKAEGKIVLNAALGFDTYVVMRHGAPANDRQGKEGEKREALGCYFCNDVVAPANSTKDQTLDQQCTVTRPGGAAIASALLVELLVSLLQHPLRASAPAPTSRDSARSPLSHPLGLIPHQIRGFLATFDNMLLKGPSYDCCSACSPKVLDAYKTQGWEFVKRVMNERGYVEELSGLAEVQRQAEEAAKEIEWDESDEEVGDIDEEGELL